MSSASQENPLDSPRMGVLEHEEALHSEFKARSQPAYGYKFIVSD